MPKGDAPDDLQVFTEEMYESEEIQRLADFLVLVKKGSPWRIATERLIRLHGNSRRGKNVTQSLNDHLKSHGLVCTPAIENADYYGEVVVSDFRDQLPMADTAASLPLSAFPSEIGHLISCGSEMHVSKVRAIMISRDISQIPVLSSDKKTLYGVVTWRSLAQSRVDLSLAVASDAMETAGHVASSSDDFLDLVDTLIAQEYLLYKVPGGRIDGIVTASDLARAFDQAASIYIKLQEIESRLRILLDRSPLPLLQGHLAKNRQEKKGFRGATDMMFGEYLSALRQVEIWEATGIELDHEFCLKLFDRVRDDRNRAMHFAAADDSTPDDDGYESVTQALRLLRAVPLG